VKVKRSDDRRLNTTCYFGMLILGSMTGAMGPLLVAITRFFDLDLSRAGLPVVLDALGYLGGAFLTSFLWRLDRSPLLLSAQPKGIRCL